MEQRVSRQFSGHYEPKSYWTQRVRQYVGIDDLGTVTLIGAPAFVNQFTHWLEERALKQVFTHLPSGGLLLDVGCGYGRWFKLYQDRGVKVVGIDIVYDLAKRGKALHPEALFVVGD